MHGRVVIVALGVAIMTLSGCSLTGLLADRAPFPAATPPPTASPAEGGDAASAAGNVPTIRSDGRGDRVVAFEVEDAPLLVTVDHRGRGNVVVWALDRQLDEVELLVNAIGDYSGTVLTGRGSWGGLRITAGGRWSVRVEDVANARALTTTARGRGDDVLVFAGTSRSIARFSHLGPGALSVWLGATGGVPILDEVGDDRVDAPITPGLVRIRADGRWTVTVLDALPGGAVPDR